MLHAQLASTAMSFLCVTAAAVMTVESPMSVQHQVGHSSSLKGWLNKLALLNC